MSAGPQPRPLGRSLKWAFVLSWGQRGGATVFTIALAAILGPRVFGVVSMGIVYVAFINVFLEQGLQTAIIQRREVEPEHLDSAFWLNLAFGVVLAGAGAASAPLWAAATGVPELAKVIAALSVLILIASLNVVQTAVLQRRLQFKKLALRQNVSVLTGGASGLALALLGAGVWSLVVQQLVTFATGAVLLWSISDWRPRLRFSRAHARDLLGFSVNVFLANLGAFVNRRADVLLMGLFVSPVVVGLYRLADRFVDVLLELTVRPVSLVSLPHFSRAQDDRDDLRRLVGSCIRVSLLTTVPALLLLLGASDRVVAAIGPEWKPAADTLKLLSVVGIAKAFIFLMAPLLYALARPRTGAVTLWGLAVLSAVAAVAAGLVLEHRPVDEQLLGFPVSRAAVFFVVFLPIALLVITRTADLRLRSILGWLRAPLLAGAAAIGAAEALDRTELLRGVPPVLALLAVAGAGLLAAGAVLLTLEPGVRRAAWRLAGRPPRPEARPASSAAYEPAGLTGEEAR